MYNLTVADVHTFVVGDGEWVVHNTDKWPKFCQLPTDVWGAGQGIPKKPKSKSDIIPGIYEFFHLRRKLPYVGQAKNLWQRLTQHLKDGNINKDSLIIWYQVGNYRTKRRMWDIAEEIRMRQVAEELGGIEKLANSINDYLDPIEYPLPLGDPENGVFPKLIKQGLWKNVDPWPDWLVDPNTALELLIRKGED